MTDVDAKIYLREWAGEPTVHRNDLGRLRLAMEFTLPFLGTPEATLEEVFEQLNVGGDIVPATKWTEFYRSLGYRSLSVGDVVVIGETAFRCESYSWGRVPTEDFRAAIDKTTTFG